MTGRDADQEINKVLNAQVACWNKGDIDCFMEGYWKSDSLKFIGKNGITYGWQPTLENYKKRYPDTKAMGELSFNIIEIDKTSEKSANVIGEWKLIREIGDVGGYFSLQWKVKNGKWVIVADHTS